MVAEPEPVTLDGLNDPQTKLGAGVMVKLTVPENPLTARTATVDVRAWPAFTGAGEPAVRLKSWNRKRAEAECDREPLAPVNVSV